MEVNLALNLQQILQCCHTDMLMETDIWESIVSLYCGLSSHNPGVSSCFNVLHLLLQTLYSDLWFHYRMLVSFFKKSVTSSVFETESLKLTFQNGLLQNWIFNYSSSFSCLMFCCRFDFFISFLMTLLSICRALENEAEVSVEIYCLIINKCNTSQINIISESFKLNLLNRVSQAWALKRSLF